MAWANVLHFYQPYGQKREIIDAIVEQCYRPIGAGILANPRARVTINFTGVLLDLLAQYGHQDVIELYAEGVRRGQVELVGSAKFHTILPLLSPEEAKRQVEINNDTSRHYFGELYQPRGIFLPEMAWSPELAPMLEAVGFEWVLLDELAYDGQVGQVDYTKIYRVQGTGLKAVFRQHRLSAALMSAAIREAQALKRAAKEEFAAGRYVITGMDGETFGHHRVGHEQLLLALWRDPALETLLVSGVIDRFPDVQEVPTVACTWASSADDIARGIQFISWNDPDNEIHQLQWQLLRLAVAEVEALSHRAAAYAKLRAQLDPAVASDQFFWAAARPWWMIEHIERGAHGLLAVLQGLPDGHNRAAAQGLDLYQRIMALAWDWQRTGKLDELTGEMRRARAGAVRIPFKEMTLEAGDRPTWEAFKALLHEEELAAAQRGDYEAAILWRDGWYKLEHKLDIYDALYVIDLHSPTYIIDRLKARLPEGKWEQRLAKYKAKYDHIRGGQVEQRSN